MNFIKLGVPGDFRMVNLDHVVEVAQWDRYEKGNIYGITLVTTATAGEVEYGYDEAWQVGMPKPHEIKLSPDESKQFLAHVVCLDTTGGAA